MIMKKGFKKIFALLVSMLLLTTFVACSKETVTPEDTTAEVVEKASMNVAALNGPTGMGMVKLIEDSEAGTTALDYEFTLMSSPDELAGKIISGEIDVAAVPTNLALVLYNRTEGNVQLAAVNTLGVLYLLENGESINSVQDLEGKTVNISGKGATPDFAFQYILKENQLEPNKDVMLDFTLQHADLAAALAAGDVDIALLPQPHVTTAMMKNENIRIALDITEEWTNIMDEQGQLAMGAIIVQKDFAENNKEALDSFLEEYSQSVNYVNQQLDDAAELIAKYGILPNAAVAKKAIPYSNIVYIDAQEAKPFLEDFYEVLFSFEPKSIGGKLGDEGFYYKK